MAYREMAQAWRALQGDPQQALDWYAQGMIAAELLPPEAVAPIRDNVAFTRAMRIEDEDDWLARGLRSEADSLYQQQNPTLIVQQVGWRLTASRRPMSNSLLSFAGSKDPDTGKVWGGVMATGGALSLSWDQGQANGVWADISHHNLKGKNVENNSRIRAMGGYYRRFINKNNELLTVGVNAMHWQYSKGLGDYTFGQGGYYSPKQYNSVSLPISYNKRTANWSYSVRGSASLSKAKDHQGGSSQGVGYNLSGAVERRLTNHLVLGAGIDLQHSKDYAPSRGMLYLRYTFEPWQGSLPLGLEPLTPYADFK